MAFILIGILFTGVLTSCGGGSAPASPPPAIDAFRPEQTVVEPGTEVVLEAVFRNGAGTVDPGGGELPSGGRVTVRPIATSTYTLTVKGADGRSVHQQITVEVRPGLVLTVEGHRGIAGAIKVTGPGGFEQAVVSSGVLTGLQPGDYTITAAPVQHQGQWFHPLCPVQHVTVHSGTAVKVTYPAPEVSILIEGQVPMDFVLIPAGTFRMGDDAPRDPRRFPNPSPAHAVTLAKAFYIGKYPTTQRQWQAVTGHNPSRSTRPQYNPGGIIALDDAVDSVSFDHITKQFLPELNRHGHGFRMRLPSEAEWEYACRAGTTSTYFHGEDPLAIGTYAWTLEAYRTGAHRVGMKQPNPWGLHDLHGLVFQWCQDVAHDGYEAAPVDGGPWLTPARSGRRHILRGCGPITALGTGEEGGSAQRWSADASETGEAFGCRVVAEIEATTP